MDKILVTAGVILLAGFIYWFFFGKDEEVSESAGTLDILVDGGYQPNVVKFKNGQKITLNIVRRDPNSCLEEFVLPDFKIKKYLPLGKKVEISFTPEKSGEYGFQCGMNMYHGKIIIE